MKFHKKTVLFAYILIFFLTYLAQIHPINALDYNISCVNGYLIKNGTINVNGNDYTFFQNTSCPYGCSDSGTECDRLAIENQNFVLYPIAMLVVAAIFSFLSVKTDKNWFQFLFLGLTMIFIILSMGLFSGYTTLTITQIETLFIYGYQAVIIGTVFTSLILFIFLLWNIFKPIFERKKVA